MLIKKVFYQTLSKKFDDGAIITQQFGTELELESNDPDEVFQKAYDATMHDIKKTVKISQYTKALVNNVDVILKREEKLNPNKMDEFE